VLLIDFSLRVLLLLLLPPSRYASSVHRLKIQLLEAHQITNVVGKPYFLDGDDLASM
jgi:hypothetical protein